MYFKQPIDYLLVTPAVAMPITVDEAKMQLRIDLTNLTEDGLITRYIAAATTYFELVTYRDLINKTYKCYLDVFPCRSGIGYLEGYRFLPQYVENHIQIRKSKLQSITDIKYYSDNIINTWNPTNYYITDEPDYASIYLVDNQTWPTNIDQRKQAVIITFVAGYGPDASYVPAIIKQALLQYVSYLYDNRGDCGGCDSNGIPSSAIALFAPLKIIDFL